MATIAAIAVVAGGVVAVSWRDGRAVILGLAIAAAGSTLVASPLPASLSIAARVLGAVAAAYLMWAAVSQGRMTSVGSAAGPLAEGAAAAAAFLAGWVMKPVDPLAGPVAAQAAGVALIVIAVVPLAGRDVFRLGAATMLLAIGCSLLLAAWSGPMPPLQHLATSVLLIGIASATCLLAPEGEMEVVPGIVPEAAAVAPPRPAPGPAAEPASTVRSPGLSWSIRDSRPAAAPAPPAAPRPASQPVRPPLPPRAPQPSPEPSPLPAPPAGRPQPAPPAGSPAPAERPRIWTPDPLGDEWAAWEVQERASDPKKRPGGEK